MIERKAWLALPRPSLGPEVAAAAIAYLLLASLAIWLSKQPGSIAMIWFANAAMVPILARQPARAWAPLLLGIGTACVTAHMAFDIAWWPSLGLALANVIEIALSSWLAQRWVHPQQALRDPGLLLRFIALPGLLGPLAAALVGAWVISVSFGAPFVTALAGWVTSAMTGAVAVAPLALLVATRGWRALVPRARGIEFALALTLSLLASATALTFLPFPLVYVTAGIALALWLSGQAAAFVAAALSSVCFGYALASGLLMVPPAAGWQDETLVYLPLALALAVPLLLSAAREGAADVTRRLAEREARARSLYQRTPAPLLSLAADGTVVAVNDAWLSWMQRDAHEVLGQRLDPLMDEPSRAAFDALLHPSADNATQPPPCQLTLMRRDGALHEVLVAAVWEAGRDDPHARALVVMQDVTDANRLMAQLQAARIQAESASQAKSMFLANMSHEIRTPMNAVIGVAHLLADSPLNEDQRLLLGKLQIAGRSLLGVINDVLDLAKIEAGELRVDTVAFAPRQLLQELDSLFGDQARAKQLAWSVHGAEQLPARLLGDPQRLGQVLSNLLSNAIKFTAAGAVALRVERVSSGRAQEDRLRFTVTDSGIGIAADLQPQLFQPFIQAELSTTRRFGGTGLGLSIVKRLVELMEGEIHLRSEAGRGSQFVVELPCREAQADPPGSATHQRFSVLLVEDDPAQREQLQAQCQAFGWAVECLPDAAEFIARLQAPAHATGKLPDMLLVDWQLGDGLDGLAALRKVRASISADRMPAALLVTQHQQARLHGQNSDGLVDAVLLKPVAPSTLFNAVNEAVARRQGRAAHLLDASAMDPLSGRLLQGVRLLVVDDSDINLEVARRMLEREGAEVVCEARARPALARLQAGQPFDAVLMDVQMPELDGLDATRQLRDRLQQRSLPVIALTAGALGEERRRALDAGMDDFLTKPLDPEALVRTLRRHIETRRGAPLPVQGRQTVTAGPQAWPQLDGIDAAGATHRLGGDTGLFRRLLARLLQAHDADWVKSLEAMDAKSLAASLHKLHGSAGLLGAQRVQHLAAEAEERLRHGATPTDVSALIEELSQSLAALQRAAEAWLVQAVEPMADEQSMPPTNAAQAYASLLNLLRSQDLGAASAMQQLRPWLCERGMLMQDVERLERWVDELEFEQALRLLESQNLAS
ncbi:MAG: response regulator [Roseateles sp.]